MSKSWQMSLVLNLKHKKGNMKTTDITSDIKYNQCECGQASKYSTDGLHKVITVCLAND